MVERRNNINTIISNIDERIKKLEIDNNKLINEYYKNEKTNNEKLNNEERKK